MAAPARGGRQGRWQMTTRKTTRRPVTAGRFDRFAAMGVRFADGGDGQEGSTGETQGGAAAPQQDPPQPQPDPPHPQPGSKRQPNEHGYPDDTPLSEMSVEEREAYWKHRARSHEDTWKKVRERNLTPDQVLEMQQRLDEADREKMTEHQRQVDDAKKTAASEAAANLTPQLVLAKLETAVARRDPSLDVDAVAAKVEYLDLTRFLNDNGAVDTDKVTAWAVNNIAEPASRDSVNGRKFPDMGGGKRGPARETAHARADALARQRGYVKG